MNHQEQTGVPMPSQMPPSGFTQLQLTPEQQAMAQQLFVQQLERQQQAANRRAARLAMFSKWRERGKSGVIGAALGAAIIFVVPLPFKSSAPSDATINPTPGRSTIYRIKGTEATFTIPENDAGKSALIERVGYQQSQSK